MARFRAALGSHRARQIGKTLIIFLIGALVGAALMSVIPALAAQQAGTKTIVNGVNRSKYCQVYERSLEDQLHLSEQQLENADRAAIKAALKQAVADGTITQDRADQLAKQLAGNNSTLCDRLVRVAPAKTPQSSDSALTKVLRQARDAVAISVAATLGVSTDDLHAQIAQGHTIIEIAAQHKINLSDLNALILNSVQAQLNAAVQSHAISPVVASNTLTFITSQIKAGNYTPVGLATNI